MTAIASGAHSRSGEPEYVVESRSYRPDLRRRPVLTAVASSASHRDRLRAGCASVVNACCFGGSRIAIRSPGLVWGTTRSAAVA